MAYLNKVMLIGNIGKDPEIRMTASGRKKVSFSLATSRRYRDNNGETREQTECCRQDQPQEEDSQCFLQQNN